MMGRPRISHKDDYVPVAFRLDRPSLDFLKKLAANEDLSHLLRKIVHEYIDSKLSSLFPSNK